MGSGSSFSPGCKKDNVKDNYLQAVGFRGSQESNWCNLLMGSVGIRGQH